MKTRTKWGWKQEQNEEWGGLGNPCKGVDISCAFIPFICAFLILLCLKMYNYFRQV